MKHPARQIIESQRDINCILTKGSVGLKEALVNHCRNHEPVSHSYPETGGRKLLFTRTGKISVTQLTGCN